MKKILVPQWYIDQHKQGEDSKSDGESVEPRYKVGQRFINTNGAEGIIFDMYPGRGEYYRVEIEGFDETLLYHDTNIDHEATKKLHLNASDKSQPTENTTDFGDDRLYQVGDVVYDREYGHREVTRLTDDGYYSDGLFLNIDHEKTDEIDEKIDSLEKIETHKNTETHDEPVYKAGDRVMLKNDLTYNGRLHVRAGMMKEIVSVFDNKGSFDYEILQCRGGNKLMIYKGDIDHKATYLLSNKNDG